jgi:hypothetical protein
MVMCKVACPECGMVGESAYEQVSSKSGVKCFGCGIDYSVNKAGETVKVESGAPKKEQTKKTKRKTLTNIPVSPRASSRVKGASKKRKNDAQAQFVIKLGIGGLAAVLFIIVIVKAAGSGSSANQGQDVAKVNSSDQDDKRKPLYTVSKKVSLVKSDSKLAASSVVTSTEPATVEKTAVQVETVNVAFAKPLVEVEEISQPKSDNFDNAKDVAPVRQIERKPKATTATTIAKIPATPSKKSAPMILQPGEDNYRIELSNLDRRDMSAKEKKDLDTLNNKYNWYKSKRYHMTRAQMDKEWSRRWGEIQIGNAHVVSRSDSLMRRPLQILLEGKTTIKERAYMMRIYMKPVSFEEKELVKRAKEQAKWERERSFRPYKADKGKKRGRGLTYKDEYGYEYYIDGKGNRVYIDED